MISVSGEQLQKTSRYVRSEARRAQVEATYHGRAELVILSIQDYALLRQNRKVAVTHAEVPAGKIERIANNRMDTDLDALTHD